MHKYAIYYRVSTEKQDLESQKYSVQKWFDELPKNNQHKSILIFKDEGISGRTTNRPGFKKMLEAAYAGKIDTIVVYKLDRFSRHATTAIRLILSLDDVNVAFISVTQPVLNLGHENPFRRTMLAAFAEIAEIERETIVARVIAGLDAAKKRGVVLGAPKKITQEIRNKVIQLRKQGLSIRKLAQQFGLSTGSISNMLK
jgi:DNA invertase Pin-like site-specific DNA recombinase